MIIIELLGTPGSGKSTLCGKIKSELTESGYKVEYEAPVFSEAFSYKVMNRIRLFIYRYFVATEKMRKGLDLMKPYTGEIFGRYWTRRILETYGKAASAERRGADVYLLDEGCMQYITSVYHDKKIDSLGIELAKVLCSEFYKDRALFIDCHIDIDENYRRLLARGRSQDRFLQGNDSSIKALLLQKRENLDEVIGIAEPDKVIKRDNTNTECNVECIIVKAKEMIAL